MNRLPLLHFVALFFLASCSKPSQSPAPEPQDNADPFLAAARAFFSHSLSSVSPDVQAAPFRSSLHKTPIWDLALHQRLGSVDVAAVPLSIAEPLFVRRPGSAAELPASALTWLLLYRDADGHWQTEVMTKIPGYPSAAPGQSSELYSRPAPSTFSGIIRVEDWQGHFIRGFTCNGADIRPLIASRIYARNAPSVTGPSVTGRPVNSPPVTDPPVTGPPVGIQGDEEAASEGPGTSDACDETDWYACASVGEEEMTCQYEYTEEDCPAPAPIPGGDGSGGSSGGSGGTGGSGGLSGAGYAAAGTPLPTLSAAEIKADTSITNHPIVECVYTHLMSSQLTQGLQSILSGFANNTVYNVTFSVVPDLEVQGSMVDGDTKYLGNDQFQILLNGSEADDPEYSRIYLASTIIHEAFHAKLRQMALATFGTDVVSSWPQPIDDMTLSELANYFEQNSKAEQNWNTIGHDWMITNIDDLAGSLREYVQTFYTATFASVGDSLAPYEALMYMGLQNTTLYQEEVVGKGLDSNFKIYWQQLNEGGKCQD